MGEDAGIMPATGFDSNPKRCFPSRSTGFLQTCAKTASLSTTARLRNTKAGWRPRTRPAPGLPASARSGSSAWLLFLYGRVILSHRLGIATGRFYAVNF
jgi:hypothetical protein